MARAETILALRAAAKSIAAVTLSSRVVYSTGLGTICPGCGWPAVKCCCSTRTAHQPVPTRVTAKLRIEKKGRGGKTVTVLFDLPRNAEFLAALGQDLKRACGVGGSCGDDTIELQGDQRDRVRQLLREKGFTVKG